MSLPAEPVRAFLALELGADLHAALVSLIGSLRGDLHGVRWVRDSGLHLTLRFLGDSSAESLRMLTAQLEAPARRCLPDQAETTQLGVFPAHGAPRVLWLGLRVSESLIELQSACERAAVAAGFAPETRPFRPHVTLGRYKGRHPRPELPTPELPSARFATLTLFRSELRRDGARYTELARFPEVAA